MTKKLLITACLTAGLMHSAWAQSGGFSLDGLFGGGTSSDTDAPGSYVAGIWVDPDGCQHWVMDLGIEGMMDSVLNAEGRPICGRGCGTLAGDVLFSSGSASLSGAGREAVQAAALQLRSTGRNTVGVVGYTDSAGSEGANMSLSQNRAAAVAQVLRDSGINVSSVSGRGESNPIASNSTPSGMAQNRRVELTCN